MDAADVRTIIKYNVERTAATFRVDVNERVEIFYMLALAGTREPTPREFNNFMLEDSMYLLGNPIFNSTYTYTMYRDKYRYDWTVEGLMA